MTIYDIAIFGGNGFVAQNLIRSFQQSGLNYCVLGRKCPPELEPNRFYFADLSANKISEILNSHPQLYFHTLIYNAAIKARFTPNSPEAFQQLKINAPLISELAPSQPQIKNLITIGSSEEYGARNSPDEIHENDELKAVSSYGLSKIALYQQGLQWQQKTKGNYIHLRPFNIIGAGADPNMFVTALMKSLLAEQEFKMTAGEQHRSFLSIHTLVKTIEKLLQTPNWSHHSNHHALNVSEPHYLQMKEIAQLIADKIKLGQLKIGALEYRTEEVWHQKPNLDHLNKLLGHLYYSPLEKTLDEMLSALF